MTTEQVRSSEIDPALRPVGALLRAKREQLGWSLGDVAAWLRIKLSYLEALEGGQVAKLPGHAYALGFLRAYSGALGLDADDMSRRFRHETKEINRRPELSFPAPVPERGVPAGAVVLLGVVVVVAAYAGWYEFSGHERRIGHAVPPVPAALSPYAGPVGAPVPSPQVATVMPGPGQTPSALPPPAAPSAAAPATAGPAGVSASSPAASPGAPPVPSAPATAAPATVTAAAAPPPPAAAAPDVPAGQITVNASGSSWVQVRQPGGRVLYDHVMKAGESWPVPQDAGALTLSTGNAGVVTLAVDGVTSPALGRIGAVRRAIPLAAGSIKDGSVAVAAPAAAPDGAAPEAPMAPGAPASASAPDGAGSSAKTVHDRQARPAAVRPADSGDATDRLNERQLDRNVPH